ncbi:MAG: DUF2207 family protein [Anaerolineae bacterium]
MRKLTAAILLLSGLLLTALALGCRQDKSYRAERFDVDLHVQEDNITLITETVTLAFRGGPFASAFREIPLRRIDELELAAVLCDGEALTPGNGPGHYQERRSGNAVRVIWYFTPTQNMARTLVLAYRVRGLVRQEQGQDVLRWGAVPPKHDYPINRSQVVVRLPDAVGPVSGAAVLAGRAQVGVLGRQVSFLGESIERDDELTISVTFPHGPLGGVPPAWQRLQQEQAARAPLWIAVAVVVLVGGLAGAAWAWRRYGRMPCREPLQPLPAPPSDLPPGLAGALVRSGASLTEGIATLFHLAERGVVAVEEGSRGRPQSLARYALRLLSLPPNLQPFERAILEAALLPPPTRLQTKTEPAPSLTGLVGGEPRRLDQVIASLNRQWPRTKRTLEDVLYERGLYERQRDGVRRSLFLVGTVPVVLGLASIAVPALWWPLFGGWPLLVTAALVAVGATIWVVAGAAPRRGAVGEETAAQWRAFRRHLQALARAKLSADQVLELQRHLTYALAFDLGFRWARQLKAAGAPVPPWFRALSQDQAAADAAYAAVIVAAVTTSSSAGGAGGAAAGGAAGGGASGAG